MIRRPYSPLAKAALALAVVSALGGCALLGGGKRAQLYRFGMDQPAAAAAAPATTLLLSAFTFQNAAAGDRLLAVRGAEAFYIARARWVSRADELFTQAAERAFSRAGLRLARRGQPFDPDVNLVLAVPVFEARYLNGTEAAPTVVVEARASVLAGANRAVVGEQTFTLSQPAAANTVPQIAAAYDAATMQVLDQVATWAAATAARAPRS